MPTSVTVKSAESVFPSESVATTLCVPFVEPGTTNVQENVPWASVVTVEGLVVSGAPSYVIVTILPIPNLMPSTVTVSPPKPDAGTSVISAPFAYAWENCKHSD